jgi:Asp-tRNA(Asn)/Glu-tRNA(Gln) amidotransferase C subunit
LFLKPASSLKHLVPPAPTNSHAPVDYTELEHLATLSALELPSDESSRRKLLHNIEHMKRFIELNSEVSTEGIEPLINILHADVEELTLDARQTRESSDSRISEEGTDDKPQELNSSADVSGRVLLRSAKVKSEDGLYYIGDSK